MTSGGCNKGGINTWLHNLISFYQGSGWKVYLLLSKDCSKKEFERLNNRVVTIYGRINPDQKHRKYIPFIGPIREYISLKQVIHKCNPDLVIYGNKMPGRGLGYMFINIPFVYYIHTIPDVGFRYGHNFLFLFLAGRRNVIVAHVSKYSLDCLNRQLGVNVKNSVVIHNSVSTNNIGNFINVNSKKITILTSSAMFDYKNPNIWYECATKVVNQFDNVRFIWIGDGPCSGDLKSKIARDKLSNRIDLPGMIDNPCDYYRSADIYFQPSLIENHSMSVLEAMSFRLPCVVSSVGGMPESVVNNKTGYVCNPNFADEFVYALNKLIESKEARIQMGLSGFNKFKKEFSEAAWNKKVNDITKTIVHNT